ncbi:MAG: nucleotidyltransferase domain-containing protein [Thaumarchaeota archaeon]|nr:nucleotidyltransferase domain-containing protein [Nitrososphaerota archaeon]
MKLDHYLEQVLGNKISISVLRTLIKHRGKIYTIRKLANDAGASHPETSKIIAQLEKFGVVKIQPVGNAYQLSLNEKSYVLTKVVEPVIKAEEQTLDEIILILKKYFDTEEIIAAAIFGSVAKEIEKEDSDIDLLVITDDIEKANVIIADVQEEIGLIFHSNISPLIFSKKELKSKKNTNLVHSIMDNHIMITSKNLAKMI